MVYAKWYYNLIERGIQRLPFPGSHKHRIIPGYQDGEYTLDNISYLTRQEHRIVHWCRYKLWGNPADIAAYLHLGGTNPPNEYREKLRQQMIGEKNPMFGKKGSKSPTYGYKSPMKRPEIVAKVADKLGGEYKLTNLQTNETIVIHNLIEFCRKNDFYDSNFMRIMRGKQKQHKGWTCERIIL